MATKSAPALGTFSRFAVLEEESDSAGSEDEVQTKEQDKKASNAAKNAKKRARKKRKAAADAASKNEVGSFVNSCA